VSSERQKPDLVIYHGGCTDGFTAAWAIWSIFGDKIEYFPGKYDRKNLNLPKTAGKHVYLVDFSYPKAILEQIAAEAASVTILDHHKTAQADVQSLLDAKIIGGEFDMLRSGAGMAWDWFHEGHAPTSSPMSKIGTCGAGKNLRAARSARGCRLSRLGTSRSGTMWHLGSSGASASEIIREGEALNRKLQLDCDRLADNAQWIEIGGVTAPCVNANVMFCSDLANKLAQIPDAPFGATYFIDSDGVQCFSLRSLDEKMDVSAIAKQYGGGGHRNASGFGLNPGQTL
jgi:hypothetical protein